MKTEKRKPPMSKTTFWVTTSLLSLTLLLGPAQISFAKNTPVASAGQQGVISGGGGSVPTEQRETDGGGGATGPIERIAEFPTRKTPTSTRLIPESNGGVAGILLFEWSSLGYYELVFDMFFLKYVSDGSELTSYSGAKQHE